MQNEKKNPKHWDYEPDVLGGFICAAQTKLLLNCKATTLYNLRKSGKLTYSKIGAKIFYSIGSIQDLLKANQVSGKS